MPTFNPSGAQQPATSGRVNRGGACGEVSPHIPGGGPKIGRGIFVGRTAGQLDINQGHNQPIVAHSAATDVKTMIKKKWADRGVEGG